MRYLPRLGRFEWPAVRVLVFSLFTLALAYENPLRLRRSIPGNPGDAYLVLALLEWGGDRSTHAFRGYWDGPMYSSGRDVMAYTDTFLPLTVPFHLIEAVGGSKVLAFNVLYLASWVLCAEATYHLARRFVTNRAAATVAALAFTFSTIRIAQSGHFQLAWACLIPLTLLAYFRLQDKPTIGRGALVGLCAVTQFLTSAYYGLILLVCIVVLVMVSALQGYRNGTLRTSAAGAGAALVVLGALDAADPSLVRECPVGRTDAR